MHVSDFDVVVLGAGIIGASVAFAVSSQGRSVALLDRGKAGYGTSRASFAWLNATSKTSDRGYHDFNRAGMREYAELARVRGDATIGHHLSGGVEWVDATDDSTLSSLRSQFEQLRAWDYPVEWIGKAALETLEPHVAFPKNCEGMRTLADAWLDVPVHIAFLVRSIRENGGTTIEECGDGELLLDDNGEKITGLRTPDAEYRAPIVIVATGPDTPRALSMLTGHDFEARFPMTRDPGLLVETPGDRGDGLVRHLVHCSTRDEIHIRPTASGGMLLGAYEMDGMVSEGMDEADIRHVAGLLLEKARGILPEFPGREILDECVSKVGIRALPADGQSVIGPILGVDGLVLAMTHSGVTLAHIVAKRISAFVETGEWPEDLAPFSFDRFTPG